MTKILIQGLILLSSINLKAQNDTIKEYSFSDMSVWMTSGGLERGPAYYIDGRRVGKERYQYVDSVTKNILTCTPCYLATYSIDEQLIRVFYAYVIGNLNPFFFSALYIGKYTEYYKNGKIKIAGNYSINKDNYNLITSSDTSFKQGEWIYYRKNGKIKRTEFYEKGKLIHK